MLSVERHMFRCCHCHALLPADFRYVARHYDVSPAPTLDATAAPLMSLLIAASLPSCLMLPITGDGHHTGHAATADVYAAMLSLMPPRATILRYAILLIAMLPPALCACALLARRRAARCVADARAIAADYHELSRALQRHMPCCPYAFFFRCLPRC